jgi:hypothetical protein
MHRIAGAIFLVLLAAFPLQKVGREVRRHGVLSLPHFGTKQSPSALVETQTLGPPTLTIAFNVLLLRHERGLVFGCWFLLGNIGLLHEATKMIACWLALELLWAACSWPTRKSLEPEAEVVADNRRELAAVAAAPQ